MKLSLAVAMVLTLFSISTLSAAQVVPPSGSKLGSVDGGVFKDAHLVIDNKCVSCHSGIRIEEALSAGKDLKTIQYRMEQKGVKLSADERSVLGIFWEESPLRKRK